MTVTVDVDPAPIPSLDDRVAAATLACIARSGLVKLTVDDVARAAGTSRATIYRAYPAKQALVAAAVGAEADRITAAVVLAATSATDLDDAVARVVLVANRELRACDALAFVAAHEPELLYPHLEFAGGDMLYAELGRRLGAAFTAWCADPERAGEWVARFALKLLWSPTPLVDPTDEAAVRRFVSAFVTPGIPTPTTPVAVHEED